MTTEKSNIEERAHFDVGESFVVEEGGGWLPGRDKIYQPTGWHNSDGSLVLNLTPDLGVQVMSDGECRVWFEHRRAL